MTSFTDEYGCVENLKNDSEQFKSWYNETIQALTETLKLIEEVDNLDSNGWKFAAEDSTLGDKVYTKVIDKRGKTFATTATVEFDAKHVFDVNLCQHNDPKPHWNPTVNEFTLALEIGDYTRIVYWCTNAILGGLVSSRDFIDLQCHRKIGDDYVIVGKGIVFSEIPPQKGRVRGDSSANIFKISPAGSNVSKITWIMSSDLKGMIPKSVVDKATTYMTLEYLKHLRLRLTKPAIINKD